MVKNLPAKQKTRVQSLGREDPQCRKWQPSPVFLPEKSHGQRSVVGYSPWGCKRVGHDFSSVQSLSHVQLFAVPWTIAHHAPLSMGFPRQEYWRGFPFPTLGDLPKSGISPALAGGFLIAEPPGKPQDREDPPRGGNGDPLQYLAWRIPWTEEPGGLQSMGSQRVKHD